jgi:Putative zincin peptidase
MEVLYRIFGPPHELLHVLALLLIGRRPESMTTRYVDIPDDLTTGQYVFVAGLPALVFWGVVLAGMVLLTTGASFGEAVVGFVMMTVGVLAGLGTIGDLQLIAARVRE